MHPLFKKKRYVLVILLAISNWMFIYYYSWLFILWDNFSYKVGFKELTKNGISKLMGVLFSWYTVQTCMLRKVTDLP